MNAPFNVARHAEALEAAAEHLAEERSGGWLPKLIAEGAREELAAQRAPPGGAEGIAYLIAEGKCGRELSTALAAHFPTALRSEVYAGLAWGTLLLQANAVALESENALLRQQVAKLQEVI